MSTILQLLFSLKTSAASIKLVLVKFHDNHGSGTLAGGRQSWAATGCYGCQFYNNSASTDGTSDIQYNYKTYWEVYDECPKAYYPVKGRSINDSPGIR